MIELSLLTLELQAAIHREVCRIKADHQFSSDILYLEDLAKLMGKPVKHLWNLRNRGMMPPIPITKVGDRDAYWVVHVAMWLMRISETSPQLASSLNSTLNPSGRKLAIIKGKQSAASDASELKKPKIRSQRGEVSLAKAAIIERGLKILAERQASNKRR